MTAGVARHREIAAHGNSLASFAPLRHSLVAIGNDCATYRKPVAH